MLPIGRTPHTHNRCGALKIKLMKAIIQIFLLGILLGSCSMNEIPDKLIPKKANEFATEYSASSVWCRGLGYAYDKVYRNLSSKETGFSVRCLRD